jgi:4-diphosphocytidyl-2-C-methyl-D-erythritol kinase
VARMGSDSGPASELRVRAPAKVNLYLEVLGRRADGFHEVRTIMQAVSLCDELEFSPRADGRVILECSDPGLPSGEGNLVVRAARRLQQRCQVQRGAHVALRKHIPLGGGLGGGSSDCAVTLLALRRLWELDAPADVLAGLATELGSDVPFFLRGGTALCEGRGEKVSPLACPERLYYVLVMPPLAVPTAGVYGALRPGLTSCTTGGENVIQGLMGGDVDLLGHYLRNDLQGPALTLHPRLKEVWEGLQRFEAASGSAGILLSGSGSSFLVLMRDEGAARRAAGVLQAELSVPCAAVHSISEWGTCISPLTIGRALL